MIYGEVIKESYEYQLIVSVTEANEKKNKFYSVGTVGSAATLGNAPMWTTSINTFKVLKYVKNDDLDGLVELYRDVVKRLERDQKNFITREVSKSWYQLIMLLADPINQPLWWAKDDSKYKKPFDPSGRLLKVLYACEGVGKREYSWVLTCCKVRKKYLDAIRNPDKEQQKRIKRAHEIYDHYIELTEKEMKK